MVKLMAKSGGKASREKAALSGGVKASVADGARQKMLTYGRRALARGGLRALTVRGIAAEAQVNLGSFVYHFGTREAFIAELMEAWYAPLYAQLQLTVDEQLPPLERIRRFMLQLAAFAGANREVMRHVLMDAASGERAAMRFAKSLFGRHPQLLFRLVSEAQQAGELQAGNPLKLGVFLVGATLFPMLMAGVLMPKGFLSKAVTAQLQALVLTPQDVEQRLTWALQGLQMSLPVTTTRIGKAASKRAGKSTSKTTSKQTRQQPNTLESR